MIGLLFGGLSSMRIFYVIFSFIIFTFSCSNKDISSRNLDLDNKNRNMNKLVYKNINGVDYHTEIISSYLKYSGSKQMFFENSEGFSKLKPIDHKISKELSPSFVYVSKIPDLSKEKVNVNQDKFIVYFDFDSYYIKKSQLPVLKSLIERMKNFKIRKVVISGYTDEVGGEDYNRTLSYKRAMQVKKYLDSYIKSRDLEYIIYAKGKCCFVSKTDHSKNRRVEIEVYY